MDLNMSRYSTLCFIFFLSLVSFDSVARIPVIGTVEKIRGEVTGLAPGARSASIIKAGDQLFEDTSIVTGKHSFIRIKTKDSSMINLGPESKMVLTGFSMQHEAGVISLLKGQLRASVEPAKDVKKGEEAKNKLFVKTRSAAMGVRGTDFEAIYNPENQNSALVTFRGKVAMATVSDEMARENYQRKVKKTEVANVNAQGTEVKETYEVLSVQKSLDHLLQEKKGVEVQGGQFSSTVKSLGVTSQPIKISPVQLNALYKNDELKEHGDKEVVASQELDPAKTGLAVAQVDQKAPAEGYYDAKKKEFAPKSGGVIDIKTGLYVAPDKDAEFDQSKGVYVPKNVGNIDSVTGQYIAPEGIKLDAVKGFILADQKAGHNKDIMLAMATGLNSTIHKDILLTTNSEAVESEKELRPNNKETFTKDSLDVSMGFYGQNLEYSNNPQKGSQKYDSVAVQSLMVRWNLASGTVFQPFIGIGRKIIDYKTKDASLLQGSDKMLVLATGARIYVNEKWTLIVTAKTEQTPYLKYDGNLKTIDRVSLASGIATMEGLLWEKRKWSFLFDASGGFNPDKRKGDLQVGYGLHAGVEGHLRYNFKKHHFGEAGFIYERELSSAKNAHFEADVSRTTAGLGLNYNYLF